MEELPSFCVEKSNIFTVVGRSHGILNAEKELLDSGDNSDETVEAPNQKNALIRKLNEFPISSHIFMFWEKIEASIHHRNEKNDELIGPTHLSS